MGINLESRRPVDARLRSEDRRTVEIRREECAGAVSTRPSGTDEAIALRADELGRPHASNASPH